MSSGLFLLSVPRCGCVGLGSGGLGIFVWLNYISDILKVSLHSMNFVTLAMKFDCVCTGFRLDCEEFVEVSLHSMMNFVELSNVVEVTPPNPRLLGLIIGIPTGRYEVSLHSTDESPAALCFCFTGLSAR
jgi:hypothetical protein